MEFIGRQGTDVMSQEHAVIAVCDTNAQADKAVREILKAGFDMDNLSIGVPRGGIRDYEKAAGQGRIVLVLLGTATEVRRAREILARYSQTGTIVHNT